MNFETLLNNKKDMSERREWIGYWGKHMKATAFRNIHPHQKVNHFPGTFEIGRKDKLWKNLNKAQIKHSKKVGYP